MRLPSFWFKYGCLNGIKILQTFQISATLVPSLHNSSDILVLLQCSALSKFFTLLRLATVLHPYQLVRNARLTQYYVNTVLCHYRIRQTVLLALRTQKLHFDSVHKKHITLPASKGWHDLGLLTPAFLLCLVWFIYRPKVRLVMIFNECNLVRDTPSSQPPPWCILNN